MNATRTFLEAIFNAGRYGLQLTDADNADPIKRDAFEAGLIKLSRTKRATLTTSGLEYLSQPEIESKPKKSSRGGKAPAPRHTAHTDCDHDTTKAARAKCRRDRAKLAD